MAVAPEPGPGKLIEVTKRARLKAIQTRDVEPDADDLALWLETDEPSGFEYGYDLYMDAATNARPGDFVQDEDGITIIIPADSVDSLRGATLDLSRDLLNPGWTIKNPNSPSPAVGQTLESGELTGEVADRVTQVLERVINPSIAAHGGRAELAGIEGDTAYLRLGGGCQGCGMAKVTLSQGIQVAIQQAVPEIVNVVDVTDHAQGANPYYQPAKK